MPGPEAVTPLVPREMIAAPFFAAAKQPQERDIVVGGKALSPAVTITYLPAA